MDQPKVLIVDDDDKNRGVLCDALDGEPYRLLEAVDGQQALDIADKEQPDLILLDVLMPGLDGIATLQKLKADDRTRHIPVIMVTALNLDTQVSMCLDQGAIDHIAKPSSNLVVRARVRAVLQNRRPMATLEYPLPTYQPRKQFTGLPRKQLTGLVDLYFYELTVLLKKDRN
ncbi:MAG: response regulator [Thermoguttaceae bacterium]|jgi:two-component system cell cycle response regulator